MVVKLKENFYQVKSFIKSISHRQERLGIFNWWGKFKGKIVGESPGNCWSCWNVTMTSSRRNPCVNGRASRWGSSWQRSLERSSVTASAGGCWYLPLRRRLRGAETSSLDGCVSIVRWIHSIRPASDWRAPASQSATMPNGINWSQDFRFKFKKTKQLQDR